MVAVLGILGTTARGTPQNKRPETAEPKPKLRIVSGCCDTDTSREFSRCAQAAAASSNAALFVLVTAALTGVEQEPWCPDSRVAEPVLFAASGTVRLFMWPPPQAIHCHALIGCGSL